MVSARFLSLLPLTVGMVFCAGCGDGGAAVAKRRSNLEALATVYLDFHTAQQRSPSSTDEVAQYVRSMEAASQADLDAIASLEEGDIVMNWNASLGEASENASHVLGFEAQAPGSGGYVVMGDGTVKLMTGKDFSEASMIPAAEQ